MNKVIVYRSQTEANQDEFIQMLMGWIYEHGLLCVGLLVAFIFVVWLIQRNSNKY